MVNAYVQKKIIIAAEHLFVRRVEIKNAKRSLEKINATAQSIANK